MRFAAQIAAGSLALVALILWTLRDPGRLGTSTAPTLDGATPCVMPIFVLNMDKRPDKLECTRQRLAAFGGKTFERSPGIDVHANAPLVARSPYITGTNVRPGNAGSALAHLGAWERVARMAEPVLILEDDEPPLSLVTCDDAATASPGFDLILMNVLRPRGHRLVDRELFLYQVDTPLLRVTWNVRLLPNIWISAYVLSPAGARKLLALFAAYPADMDWEVFDRSLMRRLINKAHDVNLYVIGQTNRYFMHSETDSDRGASSRR